MAYGDDSNVANAGNFSSLLRSAIPYLIGGATLTAAFAAELLCLNLVTAANSNKFPIFPVPTITHNANGSITKSFGPPDDPSLAKLPITIVKYVPATGPSAIHFNPP